MSTMIERMAKAAWVAYIGIPQEREEWMDDDWWNEEHVLPMSAWPDGIGTHGGAEAFRECARAALTALLEPTEAMVMVGSIHLDGSYGEKYLQSVSREVIRDVIQAALDEKEGV